MRLTGGSARGWLALWLYGRADGGEPPEPQRWLRRRTAREAFASRTRHLLIGHVARHGGALPEVLFDAAGERLAAGPIWHPAVRAAGDWRLSGAIARLAEELWTQVGLARPVVRAAPQTAADVACFAAVADGLDATATGRERALTEAAALASPLTVVARPDRHDPTPAVLQRLKPWLAAGWLAPFGLDALARSWLAIDARREMTERRDEEILNRRLATILETLRRAWTQMDRPDLLSLFPRYYDRWLERRNGLRGILRQARAGTWEGWTVAGREAFEEAYGLLFAPALRIEEQAAEWRSLGWQRTAAAELFLGQYSQRLEPHMETIARLHDELRRVI